MSQARNGVPSKEDLEAAMKTENNEVVGTLKLTTFSAVIDEVMPQIQEQIALRVRTTLPKLSNNDCIYKANITLLHMVFVNNIFWCIQEGGSDNTLLTTLSRNKSVSFISVGQENEEVLTLPSTETLPVVGKSKLRWNMFKIEKFVGLLFRGRFEEETNFQSHNQK